MSDLYRFGVSLEKDLIEKFDDHIKNQDYRNRSEAIRDLIRAELVKKQWLCDNEVAGAVTIAYDHHKRDLVNKLIDIQHDFQKVVICTQHIHIDHHNCLEILAVRGKAKDIEKLTSIMKSQVGVKHVALSMSATGIALK
jgi:CopG family transcriptional regulator, nickel-responsive regulator